jgi:hypothetical protein
MKKGATAVDHLSRRMQCFGEFHIQDPVCRKFCALRIRCAVEYSQQQRMEPLEDLFNGDEVRDRIH